MKFQTLLFTRKTLKYFFVYLLFVPLGIVSTFYGAFLIDKYNGYHPVLKYDMYGIRCDSAAHLNSWSQKHELEKKYSSAIKTGINFPEKEKYVYLKRSARRETIMHESSFLVLLLGFGSLGCIVLFSFYQNVPRKAQSFFIMLASLWAFEPLRFLFYIYPNSGIFSPENYISEQLNLYPYTLILILSITGLIVSFFILKKIYLSGELKNFLLGSLIGAPLGMFLWLKVIGPLLLP